MDIKEEKILLRKKIKSCVKLIDDCAIRSQKILAAVSSLEEFKIAKNIMSFSSLPDEINVIALNELIYKEKTLFLPRINNMEIELVQYSGEMKRENLYGIWEAVGPTVNDLSVLDIILVPGVAFDKNNHRLGRGKSFYDRFLPKTKAVKIGLCYEEQFVDCVPTDCFDISMDKVIFV